MRKYSLQTSVLFAILLLLLFFVYGCGTRKADTQVKDSIYIENNYSTGSRTILGNNITYRPLDTVKPMIIDGKTYTNVIITNDKSKTVTNWKERNIVKTVVVEKKKQTQKKDNTMIFVGIAFVFALFVFLYIIKKGSILF